MNNIDLISGIIPVYNAENFLLVYKTYKRKYNFLVILKL